MADSRKKDRKEQRSPSVSMCRKESVPRGSRPGRRGRKKTAKSYDLPSEALDSHKKLCSGLGCRLVGRVLV